MRRSWCVGLGIAAGLVLARPLPAGAQAEASDAAVEDIISILRARGLIDESEETRLVLKHRADVEQEQKLRDVAAALTEGLDWYGDLRLRYESFYYQEDSTGGDPDNRSRFRYRARLGFDKRLNDWLKVGFRLASGAANDPRSTNQTLGSDTDFERDAINIDRAFAELTPPGYAGFVSRLTAGKIPNPFVWSHGFDGLIWDNDINPDGAALMLTRPLGEEAALFATVGALIDDENSAGADPKVFAGQVGGTVKLGSAWETGARASLYEWRSLDNAFISRAQFPPYGGGGNLSNAFDDGDARIADLSAFLGFSGLEDWPVTLTGTVIQNFTADDELVGGVPAGEEDLAWGGGIMVGDKKRWVQIAGGWYHVEANSVVALFTDSDLFDGFTNRQGWTVNATRQLWNNVDLRLVFFDSDSIDNGAPFAAPGPTGQSSSVEGADRQRMQFDVEMKF